MQLKLRLPTAEDLRVELINTNGSVLRTYRFSKVDFIHETLDLQGLSSGVYWINIIGKETHVSHRLLVQSSD